MIEARQEINSLLVTMTEQEKELVRLLCRYLADHREEKPYILPLLMMVLLPETVKN